MPPTAWKHRIFRRITASLEAFFKNLLVNDYAERDIPGEVTWRNLPLSQAKAIHKTHTEGVLCGVWRKK
jgi:hypothetical protein